MFKEEFYEDHKFEHLEMGGEEIADKEFDTCVFNNCDFYNVEFTKCQFLDCTFNNCNLSMIKLNNVALQNVNFKRCKMMGIDFRPCRDLLLAFKFEFCNLDYASFVSKIIPETVFKECSLVQAIFAETDLQGASFENSNLLDAIFENTNLEKANFIGAVNYKIDPEENRIRGAKFSRDGLAGLLRKYDIEVEE